MVGLDVQIKNNQFIIDNKDSLGRDVVGFVLFFRNISIEV